MRKVLTTLFLGTITTFALTIGEVPKKIILDKNSGGCVDGTTWNSQTIKDKVYVMFYVDPDEKDTNNDFSEALKAQGYDRRKFASIAIVNLAATWMPNFAIEASLKSKQKEYPHTIYVKDKQKILVKKWHLKDDSSNIIVFGRSGKVIYTHSGKLNHFEITKVIRMINELIQ
jgi:hypothetical protein